MLFHGRPFSDILDTRVAVLAYRNPASLDTPFPANVDLNRTDEHQYDSHLDGHMTTSLTGSGIGKPGLSPGFSFSARLNSRDQGNLPFPMLPTRQVIRGVEALEFF
jgi:hypothetical protein